MFAVLLFAQRFRDFCANLFRSLFASLFVMPSLLIPVLFKSSNAFKHVIPCKSLLLMDGFVRFVLHRRSD